MHRLDVISARLDGLPAVRKRETAHEFVLWRQCHYLTDQELPGGIQALIFGIPYDRSSLDAQIGLDVRRQDQHGVRIHERDDIARAIKIGVMFHVLLVQISAVLPLIHRRQFNRFT